MRIRLFYLLLCLLSFSIQASPLKISEPVKNTTVGFTQMVIAPSDPNIMYGMSHIKTDHITQYIYRSTDAGEHWQEISATSYPNKYFDKLMVSPTNPRMLYGFWSEGRYTLPNTNLFRSEDGGKTWQVTFSDAERAQNCPKTAIDVTCLPFETLGVDRSNGLTLYGTISDSSEALVKKSIDGGKTWRTLVTIPKEQYDDAYSLLSFLNYNKLISRLSLLFFNNDAYYIDPSNVSYLVDYYINDGSYDMKHQDIISSSHDAGETWEVVSTNLPSNVYQPQLWFNLQNTKIIYANSSTMRNDYDMLKSIDNGVTWQSINPQPTSSPSFKFLAISPTDPNTLYATLTGGYSNLMRSKDAGETWEKLAFPSNLARVSAFLFSPVNAKEIYVSTYSEYDTNGVYKSTDGGDTWEIVNTGFNTNLKIINVIPTLQKENIIVQLSNYEFYRTLDTGDSFKKINTPNTVIPKNDYPIIIVSKSRANTLYFYMAYSGGELYRSDDLGDTWQKISSRDSNKTPNEIAYYYDASLLLQSSDGKIWYSVEYVRDASSGQVTNSNWSYSEDFGNTWQAINSPTPIYAPTLHPTDSNILYTIGCGLFRSIDKGKTWHSITINIPVNTPVNTSDNCVYPSSYAKGLQADPHDMNILYMLNVNGYPPGYRSTDAGLTWNPINYPDSNILNWETQLDPKTGFLYAAATKLEANIMRSLVNIHYRSVDGGQTWVDLKTNTQQNNINTKDFLFINKNELYMVSNPSGHLTNIYRSTAGDDAWQWVLSISEISSDSSGKIGGQGDPLNNRFFVFNELNNGRLSIFTLDEEAITHPQSTISDAQGYSYPSSRDGVKTLVDGVATTNKQLTQNTSTQITATFSPSAEYQNQSAELLIVSQFQPQGSDQSYWFMQTNNTWQPWDGSEANLKPAKTVNNLQATETLDIFTGSPLGLTGTSSIYTAYRIPSQGVIISNKSIPLVLNVE